MTIQNERTGSPQSLEIGDILYAQLDEKTALNRPKTWTFRCQGFVMKKNRSYILGPGDTVYRLGRDCFVTAIEAREHGNRDIRDQFRLVKMKKEERIRV